MNKKGMSKSAFIGIWTAVFAALLAFMIAVTCVLNLYDSVVTQFLGSVGGGIVAIAGEDAWRFKTDPDYTPENLDALNRRMADEAVILLRNEGNALPLQPGSGITLFGMAAAAGSSTGSGSGEAAVAGASLSEALKASGFRVNDGVSEYYANNSKAHGIGTAAGSGADKGDWSLGKEAEFPTGELAATFSEYGDAAILVLNRKGGEGGDLARTMDNHGGDGSRHYLELSPSEEETLKAIKDSGAFRTVIVMVNSANPMELGFLETMGVDAALWYAGLGTTGLTSVAEILCGNVNPSGRLPDTYVYDNFSSPAMQNMGDYRFLYDGKASEQSYTNYAEGIYMGYRYYETRYEDVVMAAENAGDYDYASTVIYPFGYGLSYTDFTWSGFKTEVVGDTVTVSVDVRNEGSMAGKEVVEVYYQAPFTDYDRANRLEKASVNLAAFAKTDLIAPGETAHVELSFPLTDMKSYDAYGVHHTYILEAGDYYITAARNAHEAVNSILLKKGYEGITGSGSAEAVGVCTLSADRVLSVSEHTGNEIGNLFDDAALEPETYLSRTNWTRMDGGPAEAVKDVLCAGALTTADGQQSGSTTMGAKGIMGTREASQQIREILDVKGYEASGNPTPRDAYTAVRTYSQENGLELSDMFGADYDLPEWDLLLNELKYSEIYELFGHAGYGTIAIKSVNKPKTLEYDGPTGINSFVNDTAGYSFPNEISMAATWNEALVYDEGRMIGNDMVKMSEGAYKVPGWYAPAVNLHRTPFSGRNYEYYSEDPVLSGVLVSNVIRGVQSKGAYVYMKHFALNDQETNRSAWGSVATFAPEQAIRELYLKAFEYGVTEGGARGIMTSNNRIGARLASGCYAAITGVLRNEWGFRGVVITDYASGVSPELADEILAAGGDLIMTSSWNAQKGILSDYDAEWSRARLREAAHNTLYVQANSIAMNGFAHGAAYDPGFPVYKIILIAAWALTAMGLVGGGVMVYRTIPWSAERWENRKRLSRKGKIIILCVIAAVVIALAAVFFIFLWKDIAKALVM